MKINDFEKKIEKSKEILDKLMDPEISLDNSMKLYEFEELSGDTKAKE